MLSKFSGLWIVFLSIRSFTFIEQAAIGLQLRVPWFQKEGRRYQPFRHNVGGPGRLLDHSEVPERSAILPDVNHLDIIIYKRSQVIAILLHPYAHFREHAHRYLDFSVLDQVIGNSYGPSTAPPIAITRTEAQPAEEFRKRAYRNHTNQQWDYFLPRSRSTIIIPGSSQRPSYSNAESGRKC